MNRNEIFVFEGDLTNSYFEEVQKAGEVAWDIETGGLNWRRDRIATCQLSVSSYSTVIVRVFEKRPDKLCNVLGDTSIKKVFHHAMFDLRFMRFWWNAEARNIACTKVAAKLLHVGVQRFHKLKWLLQEYLSVTIDKEEATSDWFAHELSAKQISYAGNDVRFLLSLLVELEKWLEENKLLSLSRACFLHIPTRVELEVGDFGDVYTY